MTDGDARLWYRFEWKADKQHLLYFRRECLGNQYSRNNRQSLPITLQKTIKIIQLTQLTYKDTFEGVKEVVLLRLQRQQRW